MSSSASEFIDEPPTWKDIIVDTIRQHSTGIWLVSFLVFSFFLLLGVAILIHIKWVEIGVVAAAEAERGAEMADEISMFALYVDITLYLLVSVLSLHGLYKSISD